MYLISEKKFRTETLELSPTAFCRLKKAGKLPVPITVGCRLYYTHDSIMEWLEAKKNEITQASE